MGAYDCNTKNTLVAVVHVHVSVESGGTWESAGMLQPYKQSHPLFFPHQTVTVGSYMNGRRLIQFITKYYKKYKDSRLRHTSRGNEDGLKYLSLGYAPNIEGIPQRNSSYTPSQNRGMPLFEVEVYLAQVIGRYQILHVAYPKWVWDIPHLRRTTPNTCQSRHASIRADSLCDECKCGAPI